MVAPQTLGDYCCGVEGIKTSGVDLQALKLRIEAHLDKVAGPTAVSRVAPLAGGACQDNFVVHATQDGQPCRFVLRSDAAGALPASLSRRDEFAVLEAATRAQVKTPKARWLAEDLVRPGAHAYFLDWVDGVAVGARVLRDPNLAQARAGYTKSLAEILATIHRITPETEPSLILPPPSSRATAIEAALDFQKRTLDALPPRPALEAALAWLRAHRPPEGEITLVHGDFRIGNFMVTPAGVEAVLDWEFAHWGSPWEDLAWLAVRDWRFGQLDRPIGGFADRASFYAAYAAASGRAPNPAELHFWEVLGNLRWAAGALVQSQRYLAGEHDLELLAIGRRAAEMEFEALRLIEVGPPTF